MFINAHPDTARKREKGAGGYIYKGRGICEGGGKQITYPSKGGGESPSHSLRRFAINKRRRQWVRTK